MSKQESTDIYIIRIKGHLGQHRLEQFEDMTSTLTDDGETELRGRISDQSALHGLLRKLRDMGVALISVNRVETE